MIDDTPTPCAGCCVAIEPQVRTITWLGKLFHMACFQRAWRRHCL